MTNYTAQIKENLLGIIEQMNDYQWLFVKILKRILRIIAN